MLIVCFRQFWSTREIQSAQARNGRKIVVWPDFDSSTLERLVGIRLANYTVGGVAGFVGQFRIAQAAGVSSAIRFANHPIRHPEAGSGYLHPTGSDAVSGRAGSTRVETLTIAAILDETDYSAPA
jgi:hypothetical protein